MTTDRIPAVFERRDARFDGIRGDRVAVVVDLGRGERLEEGVGPRPPRDLGRLGGRDAIDRQAAHDDQASQVGAAVPPVRARGVLGRAEPVAPVPRAQGAGCDAEPPGDGGDGEQWFRTVLTVHGPDCASEC